MRSILPLYMADQLGLGEKSAGTYFSFFVAACYFLPLAGGWVADKFFGKYWTIVGFSLPYILGHFILGVESMYFLVTALVLLAMGSGVIKPNISTLMGLTYDQQRPGQTRLRSDAFSIFYFAINVGSAASMFAMPPIRTAYGYWAAFLFPAGLMIVSFAIFAAGKPYYAKETIAKRIKTREERTEQWQTLSRLLGLFALVIFFWAVYDQSASIWIFFANVYMDCTLFGVSVDPDQIQTSNSILILVLLPLTVLLWRLLYNWGIQVRATDKILAGFVLTAVCMAIMALSGFLVSGPVHKDTVLSSKGAGTDASLTFLLKGGGEVPFDRAEQLDKLKVEKNQEQQIKSVRLTPKGAEPVILTRPVETETVEEDGQTVSKYYVRWVAPGDRVSVWWQVLAYFVLTVAEILISVTGLELAYTTAPQSAKGFVTACWLLTIGIADLAINAPVTRLYEEMTPANYFGMLSAAMLIVSVAFVFVARRFVQSEKDRLQSVAPA